MEKFLTLPNLVEKCDKRTRHTYNMGDDVPISFFGMAMMGEGGELCNLIAKLEYYRIGGVDGGNSTKVADITPEKLAEELGGLIIYAANVAKRLNIDLEKAIIDTFNTKSVKLNSPFILEKTGTYFEALESKHIWQMQNARDEMPPDTNDKWFVYWTTTEDNEIYTGWMTKSEVENKIKEPTTEEIEWYKRVI